MRLSLKQFETHALIVFNPILQQPNVKTGPNSDIISFRWQSKRQISQFCIDLVIPATQTVL